MLKGFLGLLVATVGLGGCAATPPPGADSPPMAADLSHYRAPTLVQPPKKLAPWPTLAAERKPTAEEKVYDFVPGTTFKIPVTVGLPLDISLEPGEERRMIAGGDPEPVEQGQEEKRWAVKEGKSGKDGTMQEHVIVQPRELGLKMGLIVTTTRRVYSLQFESVKHSPIRFVRFRYSDIVLEVAPEKEPNLLPPMEEPHKYHAGYVVTSPGRAPAWMPVGVWDDGEKMYIAFPEITLFQSVPLIRAIGAQGPQLVNGRQVLNVYILDQLWARLELRLGVEKDEKPLELVTIAQGALKTIACPGDPACPVWPAAAQAWAGR